MAAPRQHQIGPAHKRQYRRADPADCLAAEERRLGISLQTMRIMDRCPGHRLTCSEAISSTQAIYQCTGEAAQELGKSTGKAFLSRVPGHVQESQTDACSLQAPQGSSLCYGKGLQQSRCSPSSCSLRYPSYPSSVMKRSSPGSPFPLFAIASATWMKMRPRIAEVIEAARMAHLASSCSWVSV